MAAAAVTGSMAALAAGRAQIPSATTQYWSRGIGASGTCRTSAHHTGSHTPAYGYTGSHIGAHEVAYPTDRFVPSDMQHPADCEAHAKKGPSSLAIL